VSSSIGTIALVEYLITGCGGFVGSHYLDYLHTTGLTEEVVGIGTTAPLNAPNGLRFRFIDCNLLDAKKIGESIKKIRPRICVHLASMSSVAASWTYPDKSFHNNTDIFLNLLEAVREYSPETRILSVGSSEQYGALSLPAEFFTESDRLAPQSPYAVAKYSQELIGQVYCESFELDIVMTRSFNHIGPGQAERFAVSGFSRSFAQAMNGGDELLVLPTGNIEVIRDFIDVRDVVSAYEAILRGAHTGTVYNVCSGVGVALSSVINKLSEISGVIARTETEQSRLRPSDNNVVVGSHAALTNELGWEPMIPLDQSLRDILKYWQAN
jgi:GDP-4-dehydro-6-deoxy-D-mannose reductase